jgi:hypothetical protein
MEEEQVTLPVAEATPPPAPAPAPEPAAEVMVEAEKLVPVGVVQEERRRRQEAEQRAREIEQRADRMWEQMQSWQAPQPTPQPAAPEEKEPDKDADLGAWLQWRTDKISRQQQEINERIAKQENTERQVGLQQQIIANAQTHEQEFVSQNPDYYQALNHWRQVVASDLKMMYPTLTAPQIRQRVVNAELELSVEAMKAKINPAEQVYSWAKQRGYTPPTVAAPAPKATPAERATAQLSLSNAVGAPARRITLDDIAKMSKDEYAKQVPDKETFKKLMLTGSL